MNPELAGLIRHILTFAGGLLVTKGLIDQGTLNEVLGAVVTLGGVAWSVFAKQATSGEAKKIADKLS